MVVRVNVNFERKDVVWIESWLWMICKFLEPAVFWLVLAWSKLKWCIWRIVVFVSCCHYEEILNYKDNTICNMIPFANLRIQKRWLNINSTRTTQTASPPFQFLSLAHSFPLSIRPERDGDSFFNGPTWLSSMMEILSDSEGTFTFSQARRYRRANTSCNNNFRGCWRTKSRDRGCCWIGMSQNTWVLIVGMRFLCYQRSRTVIVVER